MHWLCDSLSASSGAANAVRVGYRNIYFLICPLFTQQRRFYVILGQVQVRTQAHRTAWAHKSNSTGFVRSTTRTRAAASELELFILQLLLFCIAATNDFEQTRLVPVLVPAPLLHRAVDVSGYHREFCELVGTRASSILFRSYQVTQTSTLLPPSSRVLKVIATKAERRFVRPTTSSHTP